LRGGDHRAPQVVEADDDPNRLARVYLAGQETPGGFALVYHREEFHRWHGRAYRAVPDKEMRADVWEKVKAELNRCNLRDVALWEAAGRVNERGEPTPQPQVIKVTNRLVSDTLGALASCVTVKGKVNPPAWLQVEGAFPAEEMLACANTLVHLPSWVDERPCTHPLTPRFFSPNAIDYDLIPKDWKPPETWISFLAELWAEDGEAIQALQEWFGYCLLPDTSHQKILLIVGPPRSGKGTIARILRALIGADNAAAPTLASLGTNFGLWPLLGKSLAIISDARLSGRTDIAVVLERLLSISGEDAQTVDRKNMAPVTAKLLVRFMILTNELPKVPDPSGALVDRFILLRLTRSWLGKENTKLTAKLLADLPSILVWAMHVWKRLRDRGHFVQPPASARMVCSLRDLASPVGAFVRECCVVQEGAEVPIRDAFAQWKTWCECKGRKEPGTEASFGRDLRAAVPGLDDAQRRRKDTGERIRVYLGIRLKTDKDKKLEQEEEVPDYDPQRETEGETDVPF
jgi:putative DNA primase/helicase